MVVYKWCYLIDFDNFNDLVIFFDVLRDKKVTHYYTAEVARVRDLQGLQFLFLTPHCGADQTLKAVQYTTATHSKFHVHRQPSVKPPRDLPAIFNASAFKELD